MKTVVSLKALLTAAEYASTDKTRAYLNGVYVHTIEGDDLPRYVSTDGHRMCLPKPGEGRLRDVAALQGVTFAQIPVGVIISAADIKQVKGWYKPTNIDAERYAVLEVDAQGVNFTLTRIGAPGMVGGKAVDGTFPEYERVARGPREAEPNLTSEIGFNAAYLASVKVMAQAYAHPKVCTVKFKPGAQPNDPVIFTAGGAYNDDAGSCELILMPVRVQS